MKSSVLVLSLVGAAAASGQLGHAARAANVTLLEVLEELETATTCDACQSVMKLIQEIAEEGDDAYAELATAVCEAEGEADDVCEGFMALEAPSMAYSMRNMAIPSRTSTMWCYQVFGLCDVPDVQNYTVSFPKAKPVVNTTLSPANQTRSCHKKPLQVVHISDIHVDLSYTVGASTNCTQGLCCYPYSADLAPNATDYPAGPWGDHNCDSPLRLSESMYEAIVGFVPNASFTLFTGDIVEGRQWSTTHSEIVEDVDSAFAHMTAHGLGLVYAAVGNHEASPVNSFPWSALPDLPANQSNQYLYDTLAANWDVWIGTAGAASSAALSGAYAVQHAANLVVISINTMFYMVENWWLYTPVMVPDPNAQFAWLVDALQAAEDAGSRVYILGHIPFGRADAFYDYAQYFDQIVQRYDATIAALFFGHTHRDQWELSYTDWTSPSAATANAVHYIAPALTPSSGNPTFRVYDVDPETWAVLDYAVYVANMSAPDYQTDGPTWELYYSVKAAYGALLDPPYTDPALPLTPAFWYNVTTLFEDDDDVFQAYYARKQRGYDYEECTGSCKTAELCQLRSSQSQYGCFTTSSVSLKKREDTAGDDHQTGTCPGSKARQIFAKIPQNMDILRRALRAVKGRR